MDKMWVRLVMSGLCVGNMLVPYGENMDMMRVSIGKIGVI